MDASKYRPSGRGSTPGSGSPRKSGMPVSRPILQRPYSFTHGVIPEVEFSQALGAQLGTVYFLFSQACQLNILCIVHVRTVTQNYVMSLATFMMLMQRMKNMERTN